MNLGRTVFSQLIAFLPDREFRRCVALYSGDHRPRGFSCWDQFLCMAFAQFTYRESLRDIEACLRSSPDKLYHMGIRGRISRSTLADANESHDWRIFADFAQILIARARLLYAHDPFGAERQMSAYALDSTTIDLCLTMSPWARFRERKGAVKMHTLIDLHGNIPLFVCVTDGKVHDVNILDQIAPEAGAFYVMDRGYLDFERLYRLTLAAAFFVTRTKENVLLQRRYSHPVDRTSGVKSDHTVMLTAPGSLKHYPAALRRVRYFDAEHQRFLVFLTNNFELPGTHHRQPVQVSLAGGTVLQVDQATLAHQGLFRHQPERRENPDLDCDLDLRAGCHHQEGTRFVGQPLPNPTGCQRHDFRAPAHSTGSSATTYRRKIGSIF
jgi:hypothetical protein